MKRKLPCLAMILLAGSVFADDKTDLNAAILKLAASDNQVIHPFVRPSDEGGNSEFKPTKGWVRFYVRRGSLTGYEITVEGSMVRVGKNIPIECTTTVVINNVDTTKIIVPDEAKKFLP